MIRRPPISTLTDTLFPYTTLFRSAASQSRLPDHAVQQRDLWPYERAIFADEPRRDDDPLDPLWLGRPSGAALRLCARRRRAFRRARLRRVEGIAERAQGGARAQGRGVRRDFPELHQIGRAHV